MKTIMIGLLLIALLTAGYYLINHNLEGYLDYMVWQATSNDAGEGRYATVNGAEIYYEIHGEGKPLLLLHGGLASSGSFYRQIPALAEHYQVVAVDSRGHGRSSDNGDSLSYVQMSQDMTALLNQLKFNEVVVVGWSDGGIIGLDLAMKHPQLVNKLVVIGSNYHHDGLSEKAIAELQESKADDEGLALVRSFYQGLSPTPDQWPVFLAKILEMWSTQPAYSIEQLNTIEAPTLVMVGERDDIKLAHTKAMAAAIPRSQLLIIPDASHLVPLEKPEEVNRAILSFLAE